MHNKISLHCRFISNPTMDNHNNVWIEVSVPHDEPDYVDPNTGQNRYMDEVFEVCIGNKVLDYFYKNCFIGQQVFLEGTMKGVNKCPVILIDHIYLLERKDGYIRKNNGFGG